MADFFARMDELSVTVGHGVISGEIEVDQVYAHYQEVREDLNHPRGGGPHALHNSLIEKQADHMEALARSVLDGGLRDGMKEVVENVAGVEYPKRAPVLYVNLRRSGHPTVVDDGATIYDRPPEVGRLSEEQLKAERRRGIPG